MTRISSVICVAFCLFLLVGCSSREEVDQKLVKGCKAGVNHLLNGEDRAIDKVKTTKFEKITLHKPIRKVTITGSMMFDDIEDYREDEEFSCLFMETFGPGYTSYASELYQIHIGEDVYGKDENGKVFGNLKDFIKLVNVIEEAMK